MGIRKTITITTVGFLALAFGSLAYLAQHHPSLGPLPQMNPIRMGATEPTVRGMYLGTSSFAWTDGQTNWLVDGFFSRQPIAKVAFNRLDVDQSQVRKTAQLVFEALQVHPSLRGIFVAHSHYDHSIDAPFLAKTYGGAVYGSDSTAKISMGQNLNPLQIEVLRNRQKVRLGRFEVQAIHSKHAPTGFTGGFNATPLALPAHALAFKEGISYSFVLSHTQLGGKPFALIQPSAGFVPGQNAGIEVDTVFLGTGGLGKLDDGYIEAYWQEMVKSTQAKRVYLIHWDDFTLPILNEQGPLPLKPMPRLLDDFERSFQTLSTLAKRDRVDLRVLDAWTSLFF